MRVYKINTLPKPPHSKYENYAILREQGKDESFLGGPLEEFSGHPFSKKWKRIQLYIPNPRLPIGDFFYFQTSTFVCNARARELAGEALEMAGELLPISIEGLKGDFFIYNVTNCLNVLDAAKSEWRRGGVGGRLKLLKRPAFLAERFGEECLFKIPQDGATRIYCLERSACSAEGEFKAVVEENNLSGLGFELVWTDQKRRRR